MSFEIMTSEEFKNRYSIAYQLADVNEEEDYIFGVANGYRFFVHDNYCYYEMFIFDDTDWHEVTNEVQKMKQFWDAYFVATKMLAENP